MAFLKSEDFFRVLAEKGIRSKPTVHENLREFLQLNAENPNLLLLKNVRRTLEQMSENEAFMAAIQEDVMMGEEEAHAREQAEAEAAAGGMRGNSEDEDQYDDDDLEDSRKMDTVNEAGNETNQMTTEGKQANSGSGGGLAGLRDIGELDGKQDDSDDDDDEEYDDGFEEKEDYEF